MAAINDLVAQIKDEALRRQIEAEFSNADLIKLRARNGQSVKGSAISMVLNRWCGNGKIEKITESTWRKIQ